MAGFQYFKYRCAQCGQYDLIPGTIKTHKCSYCGYRNKISPEGLIPVSDEEIKLLTPVPVICPFCNTVNMVSGRSHQWQCSICHNSFTVTYADEVQQKQPSRQAFQQTNSQINREQPKVSFVYDEQQHKSSFKKNWLWCFIVAAIIVVLCQICSAPERRDNTPETNKYSTTVIVGVQDYLRHTLLDPDSYQEIEWSQIGTNNNGQLYVRHKYRVKNSIGGYVIEDKIFFLDKQGNVISSKDY